MDIEIWLPFQAFLRPFAVPLYSFRAKKTLLHLNTKDPFTRIFGHTLFLIIYSEIIQILFECILSREAGVSKIAFFLIPFFKSAIVNLFNR